jgi:uncharacterized protein
MKRSGWVERSVPWILQTRWPALIVFALLSAFAAAFTARITVDTSLDAWFVEDAAALVRYQEFRKKFGEDEFIVLAVEADDVFTPSVLREVDRLTEAAADVPGVRHARSVTNVKVPRRAGRTVRIEPLARRLPESAGEAAALRQRATSHPMIGGTLVSEDGRAAAIVVQLGRECDRFAEKAAVVHALRQLQQEPVPGVTIRLAGSPVINEAISRYTQRDLSTLTPVSFLIAAFCILLLFRRLAVPAVAMAVVGLATLWVLGLVGLLGWQINLLTPVLVMIILVVGVADAIHIFAAYFRELDGTRTPWAALHRALRHVLVPCLVTSLTTMAGFLSLLSSQLQPIRRFGMLAALGAGLAFLLSIFLIPTAIQLVPAARQRGVPSGHPSPMDRLLHVLGRPTRRSSVAVMLVSLLIVVPCAWSIQYLGVTANPMNYFQPDDRVRRDAEAVERDLGGAASLEFLVRAPNSGMTDLKVLDTLNTFTEWLETLPSVTRVDSFPGLLKEIDRLREGRDHGKLPGSQREMVTLKPFLARRPRVARHVCPERLFARAYLRARQGRRRRQARGPGPKDRGRGAHQDQRTEAPGAADRIRHPHGRDAHLPDPQPDHQRAAPAHGPRDGRRRSDRPDNAADRPADHPQQPDPGRRLLGPAAGQFPPHDLLRRGLGLRAVDGPGGGPGGAAGGAGGAAAEAVMRVRSRHHRPCRGAGSVG